MKPVITKANGPGWVIYLRPSMAEAKNRLANTHGEQWDPIEKSRVAGGIPEPMTKLPGVYATEREALIASVRISLPIAA